MNLQDYLGRRYLDGRHDCYGLVRDFYRREYGLILRNYARPVGFDHSGLLLLTDNFRREGFEIVNTPISLLEPGDGLLMMLASRQVNHVGVYIGEKKFLHHLYQRPSSAEMLDPRWQQRLSLIVRHPDVTEQNRRNQPKQVFLDLLPPHLRNKVVTPC
jgi:cell wall-associated NlpC family hydrolase